VKEAKGNIWDYHKEGKWVCITTNGNVNTKGEAVMGAGIALQAKQRFPLVPKELGLQIKGSGNHLTYNNKIGLIFFPTKNDFWEPSSMDLIKQSLTELVDMFSHISDYPVPVCLVRPGCLNGGLDWKEVKPLCEKYLDDRFLIVEWDGT